MHFLNLTALEFFTILSAASALVTALYLFDRRRKQQTVSTLRFWTAAQRRVHERSRRHLEQPWSLLLQLLGLTLLLLAVAQVECGPRRNVVRNHVLLLDTSSAAAGQMEEEKRMAVDYASTLRPSDRVMLVEVSGLITPRTAFTNNRALLRQAIQEAEPAASALNIRRALNFAVQAQNWPAGGRGEIVYIGPERVAQPDAPQLSNLRVIRVQAPAPGVVLTSLSARPEATPNSWSSEVTLKNFGARPETDTVRLSFGATQFAPRTLLLQPGREAHVQYRFAASAAGLLRVELRSGSQASLPLPANDALRVAVFTERPAVFRPLLQADPRLQVSYLPASAYRANVAYAADLLIVDKFAIPSPPSLPVLLIDPPSDHSPLPVRSSVAGERVTRWTADPQLGRGLHSHDLELKTSRVYDTFGGDIAVADVNEGPVVVARPADASGPRRVIVGFDLADQASEYQVSTPLLLANLLHWLAPKSFAPAEIVCREAGLVDVPLAPGEATSAVQVIDEHGGAIASTIRGDRLEFYEDQPGLVHIVSAERERALSLTLPEAAPFTWTPHNAATGLPSSWKAGAASGVRPWRLLAIAGLLVLSLEWLLFARGRNFWGWCLKLAVAASVIAALAVPAFHLPRQKTAVVALVDTSASISSGAIAQAAAELKQIATHRGRNWMTVLPFSLHPTRALPDNSAEVIPASLGPAAIGTDLEAALTEGIGSAPDGYIPRVLLFSDGNENQGSAIRAVAELRRMHVPVDTVPLTQAAPNRITVSSVAMPRDGFAGQELPLEVSVASPGETAATVHLRADGKALGDQTVRLTPGQNRLRLHVRVNAAGAISVTGSLATPDFGSADFNQIVQLRRAEILYISQDPPGTSTNLLNALKSAGFSISTDSGLVDRSLDNVSLVILNNIDFTTIPSERKSRLANYVASGGGLLVIGGEKQEYKRDRQLDVLDAVLPAKLAPPHTPEGICVALVIDKSSSMEGRKIQLARLSAVGVVDHLTARDLMGVLIFDNSYQWAVPIRPVTHKSVIKRLIAGITPDGGTQIAPALAEAYRKVIRKESAYKHIVLLTDGISEEGDSLDLAREAQAHSVTISTVGLGQDVNRSYLEKIASLSGGQSYFLSAPQGLEQLLLKDVQDYTGTSTVEKPLHAVVKEQASILDGIDFQHAPPLKGFARYEARTDAETLLTVDTQKRDPLLVRWQYGLGRAAIFASDAKSRWAEDWVNWPGFDRLWINIAHDLIAQERATEATARFDAANEVLTVRYRLPETSPEPAHTPHMFVLGPNNFSGSLTLERISPHTYRGRIRTPANAGDGVYRVRPVAESALFPEVGVYRSLQEFSQVGINENLLRQIASATAGRFNPAANEVFDAGGRTTSVEMQLWPLFLALAILLAVCELIHRKGGVIRNRLRFGTLVRSSRTRFP